MTRSEIQRVAFTRAEVERWSREDPRHTNWPVVYVIDGTGSAYVGETINAAGRMRQHLDGPKKDAKLRSIRIVIDDEFNKSVCLDLESHLIRWLAGDGRLTVLNGNEGITDAAYYNREMYRQSFQDVFDQLRADGMFERSIPEIENSDLFKLSPFKSLTRDQAIAVDQILESLLDELHTLDSARTLSIVKGAPGTGKTIVAIFLMKLIADIRDHTDADDVDPDSMFAEFFAAENATLLQDIRMGLVIPQQSLRDSVSKVFRKTPKLSTDMVLTPWEVAESSTRYDLLIVDEAHRLNQRASQGSGVMNDKFARMNEKLFGADDYAYTQLDWITAQSDHQILLMDSEQSVRPADLAPAMVSALFQSAAADHRLFQLITQMRVRADADYVAFIRGMLRGDEVTRPDLGEYDLRFFDDVSEMRHAIREADAAHGLARIVAGYAWDWKSKKDSTSFDIELDGERMRWNRATTDWINSASSLEEVGSIHTVQGYDLNYAGVIVGPDLRRDPESGRIHTSRSWIRDVKGKQNNGFSSKTYSEEELLVYIQNIYGVLLTRGILGTFVYVCDPGLREWLRRCIV